MATRLIFEIFLITEVGNELGLLRQVDEKKDAFTLFPGMTLGVMGAKEFMFEIYTMQPALPMYEFRQKNRIMFKGRISLP